MSDQFKDAGQEAAARMQGAASDMADQVQDTGRQLYKQASGQAQQAAGQYSDFVKSQPALVTLAALAVGYLLGRLTSN
jgi:ElaB/YqjD/DUF883 family membrane-anchored ribosome-binding protein